jgi:hypothetical protein
MKRLLLLSLPVVLMLGCNQQKTTTETAVSTVPNRERARVAASSRAIDYTLEHRYEEGPADTLIQIGSRHYRLLMRAETDSTHPVAFTEAGGVVDPAGPLPIDSTTQANTARGYAGSYLFTLRDSAGRNTVFEQRVNKKAFYRAAPTDIVVLTPTDRPMYLGYSPGLHALVFVVPLYPGPGDYGFDATMLLDDRTGRVQHLGPAHSAVMGGLDCNPRLGPNGRAVLTCSELLRAGRPPLNLNSKPHAHLVAARFLADTAFLTVYEYGDYRAGPDGSFPQLVPPARSPAFNAFVRGLSGQVLAAFRADYADAFSYEVYQHFVPATASYYFYDNQAVTLFRRARPDSLLRLPLRRLPRFARPKHPTEIADTFETAERRFVLYIDTLNPRRLRYQPMKARPYVP